MSLIAIFSWVAFIIMHWFNRLLWLAFFRAGADREVACDEDVLLTEPPARRVAYGKTLLRMEAELSQPSLCLGLIGMVQKGKRIRERIHFIANLKRMGMPARSLALFCMCVIAILGIAKSAEPQSKPETQQSTLAKDEPQKEGPKGEKQQTDAKTLQRDRPIQPKRSNARCRLIKDEDGKVRSVEVLRINNVSQLLERGKANRDEFLPIGELHKLSELRRLSIVYGTHLTTDDLQAISKLTHIVEIEFGFPGIASEYVTIEGDMSPLGQLKSLEVVRLCKDGIHDEDLRFIAQLPRLQTLEFRADNGRNEEVHCTDKCAAYLCQAKQLRHLTIQGENFSEQFFGTLARGLPNLKSLQLDSGTFTSEPPKPIAIQEDVTKLQGKWRVISLKMGAQEASKRSIRDMRFLIQDNTVSVNGALEELREYRIDATASPKEIDLPTEKEIYRAIYELDGDRLRLCGQESQDLERPTSFDIEGATIFSMTLERMKP